MFMNVILIHKTSFATGEFRDLKSIAYDAATYMYTLTKSDNTTVTYSATTYYLQFIWG